MLKRIEIISENKAFFLREMCVILLQKSPYLLNDPHRSSASYEQDNFFKFVSSNVWNTLLELFYCNRNILEGTFAVVTAGRKRWNFLRLTSPAMRITLFRLKPRGVQDVNLAVL